MKNTYNFKLLIFLMGICFTLSTYSVWTCIDQQLNNNIVSEFLNEVKFIQPKSSGYWTKNFIHVDGNWSYTAGNYSWCSGDGSWGNPYTIENVTINAVNTPTDNGILIKNSKDDYFIIRNCTVFNSGSIVNHAAIRLENSNNGILKNNTCSSNNHFGICLANDCDNITLLDNIVNDNTFGMNLEDGSTNILLINNTVSNNDVDGISLYGDHCNFSNNYLKNNKRFGIVLSGHNNIIKGNLMYKCGLFLSGLNLENYISHDVDHTNLVNGKPLYWYSNRVNLGINDFIDAGQVILVNCTNSLISNLNISYTSNGIALHYCNNNNVTNNIANYNAEYGIYIWGDNNIISGNTANYNYYGISIHQGFNYVFENTANHNGGSGIDYAGDENKFSANNVSHNQNDGMVGWDIGGLFFENRVINNSGYGIWVVGDYNNITGNLAKNNDLDGIYIQWESTNNILSSNFVNNNDGDGIYLHYNTSNNLLLGNIAYNNSLNGIYLNNAYDNEISQNSVINNSRYGILLDYCIDNTINGNTVKENLYDGIQVYNSNNNTIMDNDINNNTWCGIWLNNFSKNNFLMGNTIKNNDLDGIRLDIDCDYNTIKGNFICENSEFGINISSDCEKNLIFYNYFFNNILKNARDYGQNYWDNGTIGNYWDDYTGIDADYNGIGDTPYTVPGVGTNKDNYPLMIYKVLFFEHPEDLIYEVGTEGNIITWSIPNPSTSSLSFNIFRDGTSIKTGQVFPLRINEISINIDGLDMGTYGFTIEISYENYDTFSNGLLVTVTNTAPIFTVAPADFSYEIGETGNILNWTFSDVSTNNATYTLSRNGVPIIMNTSCISGIPIEILVDGLELGSHGFTIEICDGYGGSALDTVWITVVNTAPIFTTTPTDFSYRIGKTGNTLAWTFSDISTHNPTYTLYRDGVPLIIGNSCSSGDPILIPIDGLGVGSYGFTIEINDGYGKTALDTVWVSVKSDTTQTVITVTVISSIAGAVGVAGTTLFLLRRRKHLSE
ncbi:MAG: NosD domain-containing protein [Promethearchaeota archaeon]